MDIKDKTILITGGARVGQFVAEELLKAGAKLAMTYLRESSEAHPKSKGYQADLTVEESVRRLVIDVAKDFGQIDGLVLMASIFDRDPEDISLEYMKKLFAINACGNMLTARLFADAAKERQATLAPIVSFIDWAVDHPYSKYSVYLASKAALRHYTMALQSQFAGFVRVVNLHPGMILEPGGFPAAEKERIIANTPTQNIGDPVQAARLVRLSLELDFLADNIYLDGGQHWRHRL